MADERLVLPPGPEELRASFGDRKLDISRKITACVACRKQKIKCHMPDQRSPCARCKRRGLSCTVNRSLQMLLEDDASWKHSVTQKINLFETFMDTVRQKLSIPLEQDERQDDGASSSRGLDEPQETPTGSHFSPSKSQRRAWEVRMDIESGPATIPAACVGEVEDHGASDDTNSRQTDIISEGLVSLNQAESLFRIYVDRLDHYLYRILGEPSTLSSMRARSSVLLAAVCTVSSLHSPELGYVFDKCYDHFVLVSSRLSLSKRVNMDDIRGLCIGAFWLHELSWSLVSIAVRASTQNHLHRAYQKAIDGDKTAYLQARLWYHVYVCDHHFSIAYGRPPMTHECEAIKFAEKFLSSCPHATEHDARLISQVDIWSSASQTMLDFGFDVDVAIPSEALPRLRRYMITIDTWRADWGERFGMHPNVENYPRKGVGLHYHFQKLYLCSHAFRGLASKAPIRTGSAYQVPAGNSEPHGLQGPSVQKHGPQLQPELEEIASVAVHSAKSILRIIIADPEIQAHLHGLSLYFDTMIVFATVFLLKIATQYGNTVPIDRVETLNLVGEMSRVLSSIAAQMHRQHLLVSISQGVQKILERCRAGLEVHDQNSSDVSAPFGRDNQYHQLGITPGNQADWNGMLGNGTDLGFQWMNFDFLANQDPLMNDDSWGFNIGFLQN